MLRLRRHSYRFLNRRWELLQLYRLAKLPQRPSNLIGLRESGYDAYTALAFDLAVVGFGEEFEAAQQATVDVPAPKERKRPTVPKAKYDAEDFRRFLGIPDVERYDATERVDTDSVTEDMIQDILRGTADWLSPKVEPE